MSYEDLREHGSESAVKAAGKLRQQGKPYESKLSLRCLWIVIIDRGFLQWSTVILHTGRQERKRIANIYTNHVNLYYLLCHM